MKSSSRSRSKASDLNLAGLLLPFAPLLSLLPRLYYPPELNINGLTTNELGLAILTVIIAALGLGQLVRSKKTLVSKDDGWVIGAVLLLLLWQVTGFFRSPDPLEAHRLLTVWVGFSVLFIAGLLCWSENSIVWLERVLILLTIILAVSQLIDYYLYRDLMTGVFFSHGITSELLALLLPLHLTRYLTIPDWRRAIGNLLLLGLTGASLLVNLRRGAILGTALAFLLLLIFMLTRQLKPETWGRVALAFCLAFIIGAPIAYLRWDQITIRLAGATQLNGPELGLISRLRVWATAAEMIKANPVTGVGLGGFMSRYSDFRRAFAENPSYERIVAAAEPEDDDEVHSPNAHNEYLQITAELGVIGLALFLGFWSLVIWQLWKGRNRVRPELVYGTLSGLAAYAVGSAMSGFSLRFSPAVFVLSCLVSAGLVASRNLVTDAPPETQDGEGNQNGYALPKAIAVTGVVVALLAGVYLARRAWFVSESQRLQAGCDFRFSFKPGENEVYLGRYQSVLQKDPYNAGAHLGLGLLLYQMQRIDESIPHVQYAMTHGYGRPFATTLQAFNYEQAGRIREALQLMENCVASFPKSVIVRAVYRDFLVRLGQPDKAREQESEMKRLNEATWQRWLLATHFRPDTAASEAKRLGIASPDTLRPMSFRALIQARGFHYLK